MSIDRNSLTAEQARAALDYDPVTGIFRWRHRSDKSAQWNSRFAGCVAGTIVSNADGKNIGIRIAVDGIYYSAHRLALLITTGVWPTEEADHASVDPLDNRIENLREATHRQNRQNRPVFRNSPTGFKGVTPEDGRFRARINDPSGRTVRLGNFATPEEASAAYCEVAAKYHGEFANTGTRSPQRVSASEAAILTRTKPARSMCAHGHALTLDNIRIDAARPNAPRCLICLREIHRRCDRKRRSIPREEAPSQ